MKIKLFGTEKNTVDLLNKVNISLEELGLQNFVEIEITKDNNLKKELNIQKEPALIIEEEAIDFKDVIFEGIIPDIEELKSMFISVIGGNKPSGCGTDDEGCSTGCSC